LLVGIEVPMVIFPRETEVLTPDGERLFVRHYQSQTHPADRTLLISHGASEHGERYRHIAEFFAGQGWNVVVGDHRGHGRSTGVPTHVRSFGHYARGPGIDSLATLVLNPRSTAVLGHSMGGLVAVRHAQMFPRANGRPGVGLAAASRQGADPPPDFGLGTRALDRGSARKIPVARRPKHDDPLSRRLKPPPE
jgi:alpha-beta hydrolase superfamily lysophospholipase